MAKDNEQKEIRGSLNRTRLASETEYDALNKKTGERSDTTWDRATENYNPAYQGYLSYAQGGGLTQEDKDRMQGSINKLGGIAGGGGGGGGGGVSNTLSGNSAYRGLSSAYGSAYRPDYSEADTGFRKLAGEGGGFDAEQLKQIYGNIGQLSEIGRTGGITKEDYDNINRKSILEQEETGGYSAQDRAMIRAKSAASSPAYFATLKDNLERQRGQTGNLANAGAVDFKVARQGAQQQGQDRINSEIALGDSIRKGRESAGQFLSEQNMDLTDMRVRNQLQGAQQGGALGLDTQAGITRNQAEGLRGLQGSQTGLGEWGLGQAGGLDNFSLNQAGGLDQYDINKAQLDMQAQSANSSRADANAYNAQMADAQYQQWLTEYGNQQKQYGIGGLESLYGTNLQASQNYTGYGLEGLGGKYGTAGNLLGIQAANRGSSTMDKLGKIAGYAGQAYGIYQGARNGGSFGGNNGGYGQFGGDPRSGAAPAPGDTPRSTTNLSSSFNYNPYQNG
jgi:hypothetical protein